MKLTGSKRRGKHLVKNVNGCEYEHDEIGNTVLHDYSTKKPKTAKRRFLKVLVVFFSIVIIAGVCIYFYVDTALDTRPPLRAEATGTEFFTPVKPSNPIIPVIPNQPAAASSGGGTVNSETAPGRDITKHTFLILAIDDTGGNTDVILVVTYNETDRSLEVVSIPRDTLVNVSWTPKLANSLYANMRQQHGWDAKDLDAGMAATVERFKDILGFKVDYWFLVDMKAFVALVDAIKGVEFDVPVNMNYVDNHAGLYINYAKGPQLLYGKEALEVLRYREGYSNQDIGRINTQQDLLMAAARQIISKIGPSNIADLADTFIRYVKTDMSLSSLIWYGNEFLRLNADNINFSIIPANYYDYVINRSYVTIELEAWLEVVNEKLNPFPDVIEAANVSILTRGADRYLYVTDGNRQGDPSWGAGSTGIFNTNNVSAGIVSQPPPVSSEANIRRTGEETSDNTNGDTVGDNNDNDAEGVIDDDSSIESDGEFEEDPDATLDNPPNIDHDASPATPDDEMTPGIRDNDPPDSPNEPPQDQNEDNPPDEG